MTDRRAPAPPKSRRVYWLSRHPPLPAQVRALGAEVVHDPRPFGSGPDTDVEIIGRYRRSGCDDVVIVAPLSLVGRLCDRGLRPLWAEMEQVPQRGLLDRDREVDVGPHRYRFVRFRRVKRLALEFED